MSKTMYVLLVFIATIAIILVVVQKDKEETPEPGITVVESDPYAEGDWTREKAITYVSLATSQPANAVTLNRGAFGDINGDKQINILDLTALIRLLKDKPVIVNWKADVNGDCLVNWDDLVYFVDWMFKGGEAPVKPCRIPKPIK